MTQEKVLTREKTARSREAVIYVRSAAGGSPLAAQEARCRAVARENYLAIHAVYRDVGVSGLRMDGAGLKRLLQDISLTSVGYVIVADQARLGRSPAISRSIRRRIEATGATILDSVDASTPAGRFVKQIQEYHRRAARISYMERRHVSPKEAGHGSR